MFFIKILTLFFFFEKINSCQHLERKEFMNKKRQSNIELLRIIAMILIIFNHFGIHGVNIKNPNLPVTTNRIITDILSSGGKLGACIFIIISGYYLINSKASKQRIKSIFNTMWLYSVIFFIINLIIKTVPLSLNVILQSIFPFLYNGYWFMTAYILLMIFIPYINCLLHQLNQKQFQKFLCILIVITLVIPTILPKSLSMMTEFTKFITFYSTGSYVRLFSHQEKEKNIGKWIFIGSIGFTIASIIGIDLMSRIIKLNSLAAHSTYFSQNLGLVSYLAALGLFLWGKNWKMRNNTMINTIASTTLGIYLIHENIIARNIIWNKIFNVNNLLNDNNPLTFTIICLGEVLIIFSVCSLIDWIRQIMAKIINKYLIR